MTLYNKFIYYPFILIPIFLITGPAIPDLIITFSAIYFLFTFIILKKDYIFLKDKLFIISIIFWVSLIFVSFYAFNKIKSFQDSLIFLRLLIIPTMSYFFFFSSEKNLITAVNMDLKKIY